MQYSARNLAACLLAIYTHDSLARPQGIPAQSAGAEVGVSSETSTIPIATSAISFSVAPGTTISSEVLASSRESIQSSGSIAVSAASEASASGLRPLPGFQTEEAGTLVPLPGLASEIPPVAVETAVAGGTVVSVDETAGATSEAVAPAETSVSLRPLPGLASSAVDEAATLVTTTSEIIPLIPQTSTTSEESLVSLVPSTEVTSAPTATAEFSSLIASNTSISGDSAFSNSATLETTATEATATETAVTDATTTEATSGFLTSVLSESSASASSATAETTRAAITSRPSAFFPITNGTAPVASAVGGGKPHGTGAAHQSLVTGISSPSDSAGLKFGNSTQTSGLSSAVPTSKGGSGSLTTLTTVSDGITQTLVTAIAAQTSGVAQNTTATSTTGSNSGAGRPVDMVGGALVAGVAGMLGVMLL